MKTKIPKRETDCEYASRGATFIFNPEDDRDIHDDKIAHSHDGYWQEDGDAICTKFENEEEQYKKHQGFLFCINPSKCSFFKKQEPKNDEIMKSKSEPPKS